MTDDATKARLEELREILRSESMSYGELHELQSLAEHIEAGDVELLEPAGVPEEVAYDPDLLAAWHVWQERLADYGLDDTPANREAIERRRDDLNRAHS